MIFIPNTYICANRTLAMMKIRNLLLLAVVTLSATTINAQDKEWGGFLGISVYNGDLSQSPIPFRGMRPAVGGFYRYNFNSRWAIKTGFNFGYIASYDRYSGKGTSREHRKLSFFSPLAELSVVGEYNLRKFVAGSKKNRFAPYLFAGIAGFYFDPQTYLNGKKYKLRNAKTEQGKMDGSYSPLQLAIPMGFGVKYSFDRKKLWNLGFEFGYRKTFTDYLDDVSGTLPNNYPAGLSAEDAALAYRGAPRTSDNKTGWPARWRRGNPDNEDAYFFFGLTISKTIRKFECRY